MTCLEPMEEMAKKSLAEIDDDFGYYPGYRAAQAKGVLLSGWFTAGDKAGALTRAVHFQPGSRTPVTTRFSNFTANPDRHDGAFDVRGMATSFHLPDGERADITALRMPRFFIGDAETFLQWQRSSKRTSWDLPRPRFLKAIPYAFRGITPKVAYRQARPLCRVDSFAGCRYNALHAFRWVNRDSKPQYVRYSWLPEIPEVAMKLWQSRLWRAPHRKDPDFLRTELVERVAQWPVRFRLAAQLAEDGDPVDDARKVWPRDRQTITIGVLDLTEMGSWNGDQNGSLRFDPSETTDGIELPEGDSLLMLRKHVYEESAKRRSKGRRVSVPPQLPTVTLPKEPPDLDPTQRVRVNEDDEIDICYDVRRHANERHAPLLLIMGLACPLTWWHEDFCRMLEEKGFPLVRFDNRDCGNSTRVNANVGKRWGPVRASLSHKAPYTVDDMAEDAAGLIRELEKVDKVHVMGISLGGMVAQALAINHPDLVLSMTCINSCPKMRVWPPSQWPSRAVRKHISLDQPTTSRTEWIDYSMPLWRLLSASHFPRQEEEHVRGLLGLQWAWSRGANPKGDLRQMCAALASSDRTAGLRDWSKPTAVIYGQEDPFVRPAGGRATVEALESVSEADLRVIELAQTGHYTPRRTWPIVVNAVDWVATRAEGGPPPGGAGAGPEPTPTDVRAKS